MTRRQSRPEQALQKAVAAYLRAQKPDCIWFHVPNGGGRSRVEAAILKGMGVRAGVPDLIFIWAGNSGDQRVGFIELKAPPFPPSSKATARPSDAQRRFISDCGRYYVPVEICRSVDHVQEILKKWRLLS